MKHINGTKAEAIAVIRYARKAACVGSIADDADDGLHRLQRHYQETMWSLGKVMGRVWLSTLWYKADVSDLKGWMCMQFAAPRCCCYCSCCLGVVK